MAKALITGASSGIGMAIARELSSMGYETILVARREDRLKELSASLPQKSEVYTADLSKMESLIALTEKYPDIDVLINNAGFGVYGKFEESDFLRESDMIDVNIRALHFLMKAYLPYMKAHGGKILNVASSAAFFSGPFLASYYASKAYVLRISRAVGEELRREKAPVTISVLCPGPVKTEFGEVSGSNLGKSTISPQRVAKEGLRGLFNGKKIIVPTFLMKFARLASKIVPEEITVRILYKIQKKKR